MATIHHAAHNGNLNRVKAFLNQGVPVNSRTVYGYTPLHFAAYSGHLSVVQELLKRGAHVNPRNGAGWTPLLTAYKHPRIVHALIKAGANPKYRNMYGRDPPLIPETTETLSKLHAPSRNGKTSVKRVLHVSALQTRIWLRRCLAQSASRA